MNARQPDRRKHHRIAVPVPIVARLIVQHEGQVQNLGPGGVCLEHEGMVQPGDSCLFQVTLKDEPITFNGRVVWSTALEPAPERPDRFRSGVVFDGVPEAAKPLLAELLGGDRSRVLILEDEPAARALLATALAKASYDVHEAADGTEALEMAEQLIPDVIFLDARLPGLDGFEICRGLKENPATKRIPVILLIAADDPELPSQVTAAGAAASISKPFRPDALLVLTQTVIENAWR